MDSLFASSATLGAVFSLGAFWLGCATLVIFDIRQESYYQSAQ